MALRGAIATACNVGGRHRNPSLQSIPRFLKLKFHHPPSHPLHRFTSFPIYQPGGESLYLSLFSYFIFQTFLACFGLYNNNKVILIGNQVLGFIFLFMVFYKMIENNLWQTLISLSRLIACSRQGRLNPLLT
jgi:hypothetical protein